VIEKIPREEKIIRGGKNQFLRW